MPATAAVSADIQLNRRKVCLWMVVSIKLSLLRSKPRTDQAVSACLLACLFVFLRENSLQLEGYREIKAAAAECKALLVKLGATADKLMSHLLLAEFEALVNLHDDTLVSYLQTQVIPSARGNTRLWLQLCGIRLAAFSPVSVSFSFAK